MLRLLKSTQRGHAQHGWLDSFHTFSFADYYNPDYMGFSVLRVINEDRIAAGAGFPTHGHRDMEIISYVIDGALEHQDTLGNKTVIRPGDVQRMSAGTGIQHSEYNHFKDRSAHFLQIWIMPGQRGIAAGYDQKSFTEELSKGKPVLVASGDARGGSVKIHQDVNLYVTRSEAPQEWSISLAADGRKAWIQIVKGELKIEGNQLMAGDGAAVDGIRELKLSGAGEFLLFDLPG